MKFLVCIHVGQLMTAMLVGAVLVALAMPQEKDARLFRAALLSMPIAELSQIDI